MKPTIPAKPAPTLAALLLVAAFASSALAVERRDKIYYRGKEKPTMFTIARETIDGITARDGATISAVGVVRIDYWGPGESFEDAENARQGRRWKEARDAYRRALKSRNPRRELTTPACLFYIAECSLELGEFDAADSSYKELLEKHPNTRYKPHAILGLGRRHFETERYAIAIERFQELEKLAESKTGWQEWLYEARLWQARAKLEQTGGHAAALQLVQKVLKADPRKYEDFLVQGRTVEAIAHVRAGRYDEAIRLLRKLTETIGAAVGREIAKGTGDRMQRTDAQCHNALGECYLRKSDAGEKEQNLKEALLAYLWTVVFYPHLDQEFNQARKSAAACFEKLGGKENQKRAAELRRGMQADKPSETPTK